MAGFPLRIFSTVLLVTLASALHFPGLISKDYTYSSELGIMTSYFLTTKGRSNIGNAIVKEIPVLNRFTFAPRFPFTETVDMCHADRT